MSYVAILYFYGNTYGVWVGKLLTFTLKRVKLVINHIFIASLDVWHSLFAHTFVQYILRCFGANSLFLQFTHFRVE